LAIGVVFSGLLQLPAPLNHDAAWHLQTAFKWLDGAEVGYGVFDINPPMTMWLSTIPAIFTRLSGADPQTVFKVFVLVMLAGIFIFCEIISKSFEWSMQQRIWFRIFLALGLFILPGYDFGQREHLAAAMITPYVLVCALRAGGKLVNLNLAVTCGLVAGIGFGIKPYFIAVGMCLELALLFYMRHARQFVRAEIVTVILVVCSYLIAILIFAPGYYFEVIPAALSNYGGYNSSWVLVGKRLFGNQVFVMSLALILFLVGGLKIWRNAAVILLLATGAGFLIAAIGQQKAWSYQIFPVIYFMMVALGLLIGELYKTSRFNQMAPVAALVIGAVLLMRPLVPFVEEMTSQNSTKSRVDRLSEIFEKNAGDNQLVFGFITSPRDIHPAVLQSGTKWADAAGAMVYLPALLGDFYKKQNNDAARRILEIAQKHDRNMIARLINNPPGVIVSQSGPGRLGLENNSISYPQYFSRYPEFENFWKQYRLSESVGNFQVYLRVK